MRRGSAISGGAGWTMSRNVSRSDVASVVRGRSWMLPPSSGRTRTVTGSDFAQRLSTRRYAATSGVSSMA
jgi:hypothetical protein